MEKAFLTGNDPRFTTHNDNGTTTCGNSTIIVTLPTEEFDKIGRYGVFNDAMRMLGNRSEAAILETESIDPEEIRELAREQLIYEWLSEHGRYDIGKTLMRLQGGHRMSPGMQEDVAKACAYADGVLSPITSEQLQEWACEFFRRNRRDTINREMKFNRELAIQSLRLGGDGPEVTTVLAEAAESLERNRQWEIERRGAIGKTCKGWEIEIVGEMPEQIGLCRYRKEPPCTP